MHEQGIYSHFEKEKLSRIETKNASTKDILPNKKTKKISKKLTPKSKKKLMKLTKHKKILKA